MDASKTKKIHDLFHRALDYPDQEREAFLKRVCGEDQQTLERVLELLRAGTRDTTLFQSDVGGVAQQVFNEHLLHHETIGSYQIIKKIGQGGMGVVYLGRHKEIDRQVAIKVLQDSGVSSLRKQQFLTEITILSRLNHPNIARLYDADMLPDGTLYFVMEYINGLPITTYCSKEYPSQIKPVLDLFLTVCEGVNFAHRKAIIHRDLKPSNILVDDSGRVMLLDFGIAKQMDFLQQENQDTQTVLRYMTPAYAAPERIILGDSGLHTDVYALGVLLYQLLSGQLPYDDHPRSPAEFENYIRFHQPPRVSQVIREKNLEKVLPSGAGSWADLDLLCSNAMHKDSARRYATVESLIRDIRNFLENRPLEAHPDTFVYKSRKYLKRNWKAIGTFVLSVLVLFSIVIYHNYRLSKEKSYAEREAAKAQRISQYLTNLFESSDPYSQATDTANVFTLLDRGVEQAQMMTGDQELKASMFNLFGGIYLSLSDYPQAQYLLSEARNLLEEEEKNPDPLEVASTWNNFGMLYTQIGMLDSAEYYLRRALEITEADVKNQLQLASILNHLGVVLTNKGSYEEGEDYYRKSLAIRENHYQNPHKDLTESLNNLATNLMYQGSYQEAEKYYRQSISIGRGVYGGDHVSISVDLSNLAVILDIQGKHQAADATLTQALNIKRRFLGPDHYETAFSLMQLGGILQRAGELTRAENSLKEALDIYLKILEPHHRNIGITYVYLAGVYRQKMDLEQATQYYLDAIDVLGVSLGASHEFTATARCHLADLYHQMGSLEQSQAAFTTCLDQLQQVMPEDHDLLAGFKIKYADLLTTLERYDDAEAILFANLDILESKLGASHRDTRRAWEQMERLCRLMDSTAQVQLRYASLPQD